LIEVSNLKNSHPTKSQTQTHTNKETNKDDDYCWRAETASWTSSTEGTEPKTESSSSVPSSETPPLAYKRPPNLVVNFLDDLKIH